MNLLFGCKHIQYVWQSIKRNCLNSSAPGRSECDSINAIFNLVLLIGIFRSSHGNALRWMPQDLTDDKSTLVQVMAWCRQATSHYLSQCWPRSMSPYDVIRPQWVKILNVVLNYDCSIRMSHVKYWALTEYIYSSKKSVLSENGHLYRASIRMSKVKIDDHLIECPSVFILNGSVIG